MSSDVHSILVGETWRKAGLVAKASGSAITGGTVNYHLLALTGANAGKWWKNSDQTWAAVETANVMTHRADGNWTIELAASPFVASVLYLEYAKESGDLHVAAEGRLLRGQAVKSAVTLAAADVSGNLPVDVQTGLDAIADPDDLTPATIPTTFTQKLRWLIQRHWKATKTSTTLTVKNEAGNTITAQPVSDDGTTETLNAPS